MNRLLRLVRRGCFASLVSICWHVCASENAQHSNITVYFTHDSAMITPEAAEVLLLAAEIILKNSSAAVLVIGHTDTTGAKSHNRLLSMRRASAVVNQLKLLGVMPKKIQAVGKGENDLPYLTPDATPEPLNRCVVVRVAN